MNNTETGGPAFPREDYQTENAGGQIGMTLRDYFAAKAMQGYCSDPTLLGALGRGSVTPKQVCSRAYQVADAMLEARK